MALVSQAIEEKEFDIRTIERNLAKGLVSPDVIRKHTDALPDDGDNAEPVNTEELFSGIELGQSPLRQG